MHQTRPSRGFNLIELLVVISIIALLSSVVLASLGTARERARIAAARQFGSMVDRVAGDQAVGIWDFDECSGATANDRSGNGYTGTLTGSPSWSSDTPSGSGCSILFSGANWVALANSASLDVGQTFTISAWIKPDALTAGWQDVLAGGINDVGFGYNPTNGGVMRLTKVSIIDATPSPTVVTTGAWHHVAAVFSSGSLTYYLDGKEAGKSTFAQTFTSGLKRIGSRVSLSGSFAGRIDQVRVFTKDLTAAEVNLIFASEKASIHVASN